MWHGSGDRFQWRVELFHNTPKVEMAETDCYANLMFCFRYFDCTYLILFCFLYIYLFLFYFLISFYYYAFYCTFVFYFIIMLFNVSIPFYCTLIFSFLLWFLLLSFFYLFFFAYLFVNKYITCYSPTHVFCYSRIGSCTIYKSQRGHVVCLVTMFTPHTGRALAFHMTLFTALFGLLLTFFLLRAPVRLHRALAFHWHTTRLSTTHFFHFSPNSGPFSPIPLFVILANRIPPFPMTSQPLHPTRNAVFILQSTSRWRPAHNSSLLSSTNIAQHYIPIYTAATNFPILYPKI